MASDIRRVQLRQYRPIDTLCNVPVLGTGESPPMENWLPLINTALIVVSGISAALGYVFIRQWKIQQHKIAMLTATSFAALFLIVYVTRFVVYGSKLFVGEGAVRVLYFAILISHTILAIATVPLVLTTLYRALKRRFRDHKKIARVTLPIWLYVAVTGWVIYMMLYQLDLSSGEDGVALIQQFFSP